MSRMTSVSALALTLGLVVAPLAFAQGGSTEGSTSGTTETKAQPAQAQPAAATKAAHAKHAMATPKVDLNSATRDELVRLPGIGDATADKIIAARPFKSKSQLLSKKLVTRKEYAKISSRLVAKSTMAASK